MSELSMMIDRLTVVTQRVVHLTGGPVLVQVPPLLEELMEEVQPSGEGGGGSGGSVGAGAPVALDLLVLLSGIEQDVAHLVWLARSAAPGTECRAELRGLSLCQRVRWVAHRLEGSAGEEELVAMARSWTRRIEALFDPPKVVPLWDKTCPACECERTPRWDEGQEAWVNVAALTVTLGRSTVARCGECGAEWRGEEIMGLAQKLGIPPTVLHLLAV